MVLSSTCPEDWKYIEQGLREQWNMFHVISALNVNLFLMRCLGGWGVNTSITRVSTHWFPLAFADTDYKFIEYDITSAGSSSDSQILECTDLGRKHGIAPLFPPS